MQAVPLPQVVDLGVLLDILHREFPSLPPLQHVFLDCSLLDDTPRAAHNGILVTPASPRHSSLRPLIPEIDLNVDLLERRPGFYAWYNTFVPFDLKGRPQGGPGHCPSTSQSSSDPTDASASFVSDWVEHDEQDFEPLPLAGNPWGSSSTSTTTAAPAGEDVWDPYCGVEPSRPHGHCTLRVFLAAKGMPPGTLCVSNHAALHVIFARTLHYVLQHLPIAFRPCIQFNPRSYAWREEAHVLFATVRGEGSGTALVWVVDRLSEARPRAVEVRGATDFHSLLRRAGIVRHRDAATINGNSWDGQPHVFRDGDVVYVCLYAAMRGDLRWKFHLRTMSLDTLRQTFPHSALLAFPVVGPLVIPLVQPGQALSPAERHAHVSLHSLLNHFREACQALRATFLQSGTNGILFAGPGIPAFRVGVSFPPSSLADATAFYRDFLEPYFGRREIFGTGHHMTDAYVLAALPPGDSSCTWLVPQGCGIDSFPGGAGGEDIHTREIDTVPQGSCSAVSASAGIGICGVRVLSRAGLPYKGSCCPVGSGSMSHLS